MRLGFPVATAQRAVGASVPCAAMFRTAVCVLLALLASGSIIAFTQHPTLDAYNFYFSLSCSRTAHAAQLHRSCGYAVRERLSVTLSNTLFHLRR
jgi:hypothetical protein